MLVNTHRTDMDKRLENEFDYLCAKYPNVAFNMRDWNAVTRMGKEYLYPTEGYITIPQNYDINIINNYKGFLTHNKKFYERYKNDINVVFTNGPMDSHNYYALDSFISYEERIPGICAMYKIYQTKREGDILHMRSEVMHGLPLDTKHTYGKPSWGDDMYQGCVEGVHPNHEENLKIINKYHFVLALEPMYHEMWSYNWITERLWNAFKSKTVPVYYGCYNVEELVPTDLFIDYRKFSNLTELAEELKNFPQSRWEDMTEKAYNWYYNTCRMSNMDDLEDVLRSCV